MKGLIAILALVGFALPSYALGNKTTINNNVNVNGAQVQQGGRRNVAINNNINSGAVFGSSFHGNNFHGNNFRFNSIGYSRFNTAGFYGNNFRFNSIGYNAGYYVDPGPVPTSVFGSSFQSYSQNQCEQLPAPQLQQELITTPPSTRRTTVVEETIPGFQYRYIR